MILMWPCKVCKQLSTDPEGCLIHRPQRAAETFEEELLRAMTTPLSERRTDGVVISGMRFDEPGNY